MMNTNRIESKKENILKKWGVKYKESCPIATPEVRTFLENWIEIPNENLLITEEESLDCLSSIDVTNWLITNLLAKDQINSFVFKVNPLRPTQNSFEEQTELISKANSADFIWIEELLVAELTPTQKSNLYSFLSSFFRTENRVIITTSVCVETLIENLGWSLIKLLTRNTTMIQI